MKHLSLKESAYGIIKNKLLNLEFEPGSRIREDLIAEEIAMSRTPVREAINQLCTEGLILNVPRKGLFFVDFPPEEVTGLLEVREVLETLAIEKCIEKVKPEQFAELEEILKKTEAAIQNGDVKECNALDGSFHKKIAEISANGKVIKFIAEIEDSMRLIRGIGKKTQDKIQVSLDEHRVILDCIRQKDKEGAVRAVRENIKSMKATLGI